MSMIFKKAVAIRHSWISLFAAVGLIFTVCRVEASSITSALQPYVDQHSMAGAVTLVASGSQVLALDAVGYATLATGTTSAVPMATNDLFWIASMNKAMTCTALMMLVEEGKLSVDDPVEKYLPEFKGEVVWDGTAHTTTHAQPHPFTIREAMSMTAGFQGPYSIESPTIDVHSLADTIKGYASVPLATDPGTNYSYANSSINTVGRVVEVVSGMPYEQFLSQRLTTPLGMVDTTYWPTAEQLTRLATSYKANSSNNGLTAYYVNQLNNDFSGATTRYACPAGGLFSTASDIGKFCQMLLNGGVYGGKRYLSLASVQQMTSKQTADSISTAYGFGWGVTGNAFNHAGAYKTNMDVNMQLGLVRVFMVQQGSDWPNGIGSSSPMLDAFMTTASNMVLGSSIQSPGIPTTGTTVMQDNFTYTTANINGHAPTTGTGTWIGSYSNGVISTNGTSANFVLASGTDPANINCTAKFRFVPKTNTLYALSVTFKYLGCVNRDCWAGVGFSSDIGGSYPPWMLVRQQATPTSDGGSAATSGSSWLPGWTVYAAFYPNITATVTLNTQTNQAKYYLNGFYEGSTSLSSPNNIQYLYFQSFRMGSDMLCAKNVTLTEMSLNAWAKSYFPVAQQSDPNIVGPSAKPMGDGICNLLKYYCAINPATPMADSDRAALPTSHIETSGTTQYLTMTYRKSPWAAGVDSSVQACTDLSTNSWQTVTPDTTKVVSTDCVTGNQTVKVGVNITGTAKKFIRLRVGP